MQVSEGKSDLLNTKSLKIGGLSLCKARANMFDSHTNLMAAILQVLKPRLTFKA